MRYSRPVIIALFIATLLAILLVPGQADTPTQAPVGADLNPQTTPLIQCNLGLAMPLLLAGMVTVGCRANVKRKK